MEEGELDENSVVRNFRTVQKEGAREVKRSITYYNLDMILAIGYRVRPLGLGQRKELGKDFELVLEHRAYESGDLVGFHGKKAFGQPAPADSIAKPSPWLAEQRHPPFGRSLLGKSWFGRYILP